jgi:rhodanese-related sulfurtransferase
MSGEDDRTSETETQSVLNRLRGLRTMRDQVVQDQQAPEIDVVEAAKARAIGAVQIVDVREPDEWRTGHIPGAIHIPLGQLNARLGELDRSRPTIMVCRSGRRSLIATEALIAAGFPNVVNLAGGMIASTDAKQPVTR